MKSRTRDIIFLAAGLAVLLAAVIGGYPWCAPAPQARARPSPWLRCASPTPGASGAPAPQYERWTVGKAARPLIVYRRADGSSPVLDPARPCTRRTTTRWSCWSTPSSPQGDQVWYRIWVPVRPNETRGWIPEGQLALLHDLVQDHHRPVGAQALRVPARGPGRQVQGGGRQAGPSTPTGFFFIDAEAASRRTRTGRTACSSSASARSRPSSTTGRTAGRWVSTAPMSRGSSARRSATGACA